MEDLRALCGDLGFRNVETYVRSGNIVLQSSLENPTIISKRIGAKIIESFGFEVPVIVRTSKEMRKVISNNPFLKENGIDSSKLYVTFLSEIVQKPLWKDWRNSRRVQTDFILLLVRSTFTVQVDMGEPDYPTLE
jgi:uncharacterized protein (DUF1697 family)